MPRLRTSSLSFSVVAAAAVFALARPAAADPIRIVAFGDSWTYGRYLDNPQDAYPAQLQAALKDAGIDVVIQNAGMNGDTSADALERVDAAVPLETKIALVEFGINDARNSPTHPAVDPAVTVANLDKLVRNLESRGVLVMLIGARDLDYSRVAADDGAAYEQWPALSPEQIGSDGHHPNAAGYKMFVADMLPKVEQLIARAAAAAHR